MKETSPHINIHMVAINIIARFLDGDMLFGLGAFNVAEQDNRLFSTTDWKKIFGVRDDNKHPLSSFYVLS